MLKALFKKQFLELNTFYFQDKKTGALKTKRKVISTIVLYALLMLFLASAFAAMSLSFVPLLFSETPWLYYTLTGMTAILMGVLGSVFNTYAGMYHAKDNELLLSMPIPPSNILLVRIFGVALMALMYEAIVFIPAAVVRFIYAGVTFGGIISAILLFAAITVLVIVLTCFLGWIVALLAAKFKNKSFLTVAFALVFFAAYYYFFSQSYTIIESLMLNSEAVGETVRTWLYPFYLMGMGGEGDVLSLLLFVLLVTALFALTWFILSKTFVSITTKKEASAKKVYKEKTVKAVGADKALFRKELKRFTSSANYMLNTALGSFFMVAAAVLVLIYSDRISVFAPMLQSYGDYTPLIVVLVSLLCAAMNDITAPSVSLEGKSVWIAQSMPVEAKSVLEAKQKLHWVITMPPAVLLTAASAYAFRLDFSEAVFAELAVVVFIMLSSAAGLALNLKKPNLTWTNESIPVKQSMAALVIIFGGWAVAVAFAAAGYFLESKIGASSIIVIFAAIMVLCTRLINRWLGTKGAEIFEGL
ncbi:MAG: hypothetical protein Q4A83_05960 [Bacillota bacterium]|nr:hypothetical protein [Bacillota bacterium]